jgi:hypothetical protein
MKAHICLWLEQYMTRRLPGIPFSFAFLRDSVLPWCAFVFGCGVAAQRFLQDIDGETQMGRAGERKPPEGWKSLG